MLPRRRRPCLRLGPARLPTRAPGPRRFASGFLVPRRGEARESARLLSPSDLAAAVRVASQAPSTDLRLWRSYAQAALFHAGALRPKQLAFIANGFARAAVPDRELFRRLAERALEAQEFEPRDTALLLNAFARLEFRDLEVFARFAASIRGDSPVGYGEQQLSLITNAFAKLQIVDARLFQTMSAWIVQRAPEFTPQGIATVCNAYAKVLIPDRAVFLAFQETILERSLLVQLEPRHVANLLNAHARLQLRELPPGLLELVPAQAQRFLAVEVAAVVNAVSRLDLGSPRLFLALAGAVRERAAEFRARQMAQVLHAFSASTLGHGPFLREMGPAVLAGLGAAEDQSLVLLLGAYARAGAPPAEVLEALLRLLEPRLEHLEAQAQVQAFYALGRLGLARERLTGRLAALLRSRSAALSPQHLANCLFASSRLGLESPELAGLVEALQARLPRAGPFEPQHLANILHALAALQGPQPCPVVLPATVVPALVGRVLGLSWADRPQLLSSIAISCAELRHESEPLFQLASRTVRGAELSTQDAANLLAAFSSAESFDLELFTWALERCSSGAALRPLLTCLRSLDYANACLEGPAAEHQLLFPASPPGFRRQALGFYGLVGRSLLAGAQRLPAQRLLEAALPVARASLLASLPPFDLLGAELRRDLEAKGPPPRPLEPQPQEPQPLEPEPEPETAMALLCRELQKASLAPAALLRRLARYASLQAEVPAAVLDPLLHLMAEQLASRAKELGLPEIAEALRLMSHTGVRPRLHIEALARAAEAQLRGLQFPCEASEAAAAAGLAAFHEDLPQSLLEALVEFVDRLVEALPEASGPRTVAPLLSMLSSSGALTARRLRGLLAGSEREGSFEDRLLLLRSLLQVAATSPEEGRLLGGVLALTGMELAAGTSGLEPREVAALLHLLSREARVSGLSRVGVVVLVGALAEQAASTQDLSPSDACSCLGAFARLHLVGATVSRAEVQQALERGAAGARAVALAGPQVSLMRAALAIERRRLLPADAAQAALFCSLALDAPGLSEAPRSEARQGLAPLLELLCAQERRWSSEDRRLVGLVAVLLRSEVPELLRDPQWLPRPTREALLACSRQGRWG